ncbi:rRNA methyltransferase [Dictyostelium discoideum AX4]|uniref:pre-rRNA 2'-O-ribose RNA methyltransferase n=1 Tax=Dictyostelium discoideum TaxID=44689 RepID=SPB1_DICDI|nr:rRNA methyltransferase [Dictyostelium discoideum AX4]Q54NX0.1 RecName: Full=pre-rRNA 2'-O-ribose RNA methyltransferase [Dictyostelium discoideum]EAL64936.1 rRNA methyltransferase [Dictyostelium discoideum AX4]|eukprot:XP_639947.1 rRNA methyltransferase [Dictyostelium discoideum AX4]
MGQKKKKLAKGRLDKFYYMAKEQGYRSRAAFKLIQLNKKYNFLGTAKACLDLCAAPGGWMQVASKYMPVQSLIVGVDLVPIRQVRNCIGLTEDITTQKCRTEIKKALKTWKVDVCLHDGAPNMGTSWVQDAYQQAELTLHALKLATEFLTTGGWFVTKVFRGSDYNSLIWVFNKLFKKVESTKPPSSRNASAEIFVVCQGFLNPKRIDPKLLDPKFVFKEIQEVKKVDVLSEKKKVNRAGYEDGVTVLYKKGFISDFVNSNEHLQDLANFNAFEFDEAAKIFEQHELTTPEIKELVKDLKVLNKNDFQKIIKWKKAMAAYKEKLDNPDEEETEKPEEKKELTAEEMEENLQEEMKEYLALVEKKKRKEKKRQNELKRKHQRKIELTMHIPGDKIEETTDGDLYSMKGKDEFDEDIVADHSDISSDEFDSDDSDDDDDDDNNGDSKLIDDDEYLEQQLDEQYKLYQQRIRKKAAKLDDVKVKKDKIGQDGYNEDDEEFVEEQEESNPLLVGNKRKEPDAQAVSSLFFDNELFGGVEYRNPGDSESEPEQDGDDDQDDENNKPIDISKLKKQKPQAAQPITKKQKTTNSAEFGKQKSKYQKNPTLDDKDDQDDDDDKGNSIKGFEEVPVQEEVEYESDSDEDIDDKIKTKALGEFLIRKKSRQDLIDDSFNKYAFNDTGLPNWFTDDENRHNKAQTPLTKEMVDEIRRKIKEIDDRPIKKIAEAKARKKYRLGKKMEKTRDKASSIVDNPEMSNREKSKAIEKLYSGTDKKNMKPKKIIMIAKKSKTAGGGTGKYKIVDKRMKKDLRAQKNKLKTVGRSKDSSKKSKPSGGKNKK